MEPARHCRGKGAPPLSQSFLCSSPSAPRRDARPARRHQRALEATEWGARGRWVARGARSAPAPKRPPQSRALLQSYAPAANARPPRESAPIAPAWGRQRPSEAVRQSRRSAGAAAPFGAPLRPGAQAACPPTRLLWAFWAAAARGGVPVWDFARFSRRECLDRYRWGGCARGRRARAAVSLCAAAERARRFGPKGQDARRSLGDLWGRRPHARRGGLRAPMLRAGCTWGTDEALGVDGGWVGGGWGAACPALRVLRACGPPACEWGLSEGGT